jgi:hypothetical protein
MGTIFIHDIVVESPDAGKVAGLPGSSTLFR